MSSVEGTRRSRRPTVRDHIIHSREVAYYHFNLIPIDLATARRLTDTIQNDRAELDAHVELVADPERPRVGCVLGGELIAWLPDEVAGDYYGHLIAASEDGFRVHAPMRGYWDLPTWWNDLPRSEFQDMVTIHLPPPSELVPLNRPPGGATILLPLGPTITVTGEEGYMQNIAPWVLSAGSSAVYASLHVIEERRPRSTRRVVEVRVEGDPVGKLTDLMSDQTAGLVDELEQHGVTVACHARVVGNSLAADVKVYPPRREKISNAWLREQLDAFQV